MRNWHSLFEILKFPLEVVFLAMMIMGLGNLLTNPAFGIGAAINNDLVTKIGEMLVQTGRFLIVNFPLLFMIRLSARKGGAGTTFISSLAGYLSFLMATVFFARTNLGSTAYSSILGISVNGSTVTALKNGTHYPLQTGLIGVVIIVFITLLCFKGAKKKNEYGFFGFISWEASCTIRTIFFSFLAGIAVSYAWPYVVYGIQKIISFIAVDTTNPINLTLYGVLDGLLNSLGIGAMIRQPFWYGTSGGTWVNFAGASIAGDANIWSAQYAAGTISGISGRFITPYYVLNLFAIPGMIWGLFSLYTDPIERRRKRLLAIAATIASILSGTWLPLELLLLVLCPLLFFFHLLYSGILFGVLPAMHCYLGYNTTATLSVSAMPGTLPEFLTYLAMPSLQRTMIVICIVGVLSMFVYFYATRLYFKRAAIDLFNTGDKQRLIEGTVKAVGGIENIKMLQSSMSQLVVQVYDPMKVDVARLKELGSFRVYETRAGFRICYGAGSTMVRMGIAKSMRDSIRNLKVQDIQ
jgi:phosphotransferase system  glucose/maltose/N-acetylglucosamine-specific IIC component